MAKLKQPNNKEDTVATQERRFPIESSEIREELSAIRNRLFSEQHAYDVLMHVAQRMALKTANIPDGTRIGFDEQTLEFVHIIEVPDEQPATIVPE